MKMSHHHDAQERVAPLAYFCFYVEGPPSFPPRCLLLLLLLMPPTLSNRDNSESKKKKERRRKERPRAGE